jgi:hypothetical protein
VSRASFSSVDLVVEPASRDFLGVSMEDRGEDSGGCTKSSEARGKLDLVDSPEGRGDASSSGFAERPLGVSGLSSDVVDSVDTGWISIEGATFVVSLTGIGFSRFCISVTLGVSVSMLCLGLSTTLDGLVVLEGTPDESAVESALSAF